MNQATLKQYLSQELNFNTDQMEWIPLHEHASYRSYGRVRFADGQSVIVMSIPTGQWSVSEEITNEGVTNTELPFLNMARYLKNCHFAVPEVIGFSETHGLIVLQDLGNKLLEDAYRNNSLENKMKLYEQAITLLVDFQNKTIVKADCIAFERSFDKKLLEWELQHFFEYGIEKRLDKKISAKDKDFFAATSTLIVDRLINAPQVLVHRDFQSRNLMIHDDKLWLIDFQDALMGPITYDLVALLRDSYVVLDRRMREHLIDEYLHQQSQRYGKELNRKDFSDLFDWNTIQRKLKDTGRFVFIDQVKGNDSFLQYIPDTLKYVKEALTRQTELKEFYERLKAYLPEWN